MLQKENLKKDILKNGGKRKFPGAQLSPHDCVPIGRRGLSPLPQPIVCSEIWDPVSDWLDLETGCKENIQLRL